MSALTALERATADAFHEALGARPKALGFAPGRVNLIGEYTDFNNGFVLPMAIDRGICVALRPRADDRVSLHATAFSGTADATASTQLGNGVHDLPAWARYLLGTAELHLDAGCPVHGFDALVHADLGQSGGLSSSAALCTATAMALQHAFNCPLAGVATAQLCQQVEHRYAGVACGIMDQLACRLGQRNAALLIDCADLRMEAVPLGPTPPELIVIDSGVARALHASEYNKRGGECAAAVQRLQQTDPGIADLRGASLASLSAARAGLGPLLYRRAHHVISENQRVLDARDALLAGRFAELGTLMFESHASLRDDFEVSVAELDLIVDAAAERTGSNSPVFGARLTGAGFGGNAIALVEPGSAAAVIDHIQVRFAARFNRQPACVRIGPAQPARATAPDPH